MAQSVADLIDDAPTEREETCTKHGAYTAKLIRYGSGRHGFQTHCQACVAEQTAEREAQEKRRRDEDERERRRAWLADSGIAARFADATLEHPNGAAESHRLALDRCRAFAGVATRGSGGGLALLGPTGVGKTHMVAAMLRYLIERGVRGQLVTARDLIREIRSTWRRGSQASEAEVIDRRGSVPILFVDDLGVGFGTEAEGVHLLDVIDARYRAGHPTVITSNLTLPELRPLVGDRVFDRLLDGAAVVVCDWPSLRNLGRPRA